MRARVGPSALRRRLLAVPLAGLAGLTGVAAAEAPPAVGQPAPGFRLQSLDGSTHELAALVRQRRVTVVNFWATWCGPCVAEMPEFDEVAKKLESRGLTVLAINVGEKPEKVRAFAQRMHLSFPLLLDPEGSAREAFAVFGSLPVTLVIDGRGVLRHRFTQPTRGAVLEAAVAPLLKPAY